MGENKRMGMLGKGLMRAGRGLMYVARHWAATALEPIMFIVSYRPLDALHIETQYFGPFDMYIDAEDFIFALPPAIECAHKYIITLDAPNYDANGLAEVK
jgi:hypothetical protein